ncbi:sodium/potassium-transporting ATPase subunit beta-2-like [Lutzomyia longipalpis]|uniref:sodium/potassium-transporting ATPase subunit beta-2-like n=1 Tax=Lutzomyia longipalpis TaxID=7200 RepID=UPI0024833E7B|nr:sodium/potassium-transporting ATPase subunit beta-2-like [Lutzomyia longipalpis]XP_055682369.1 sodium/potassium-transporting ATPase subunit beta-2-like [Lutzomyia longipalpis]XP_055682370.1 sodium/potassium-transporting ATPase subunit beta-2-like [Lutzomyia longipalpis]XP_055682372.1 sodium/potassium-transporting ATPase subunit beta-2-like [Lutzomyia longipalpis]XP_055682373.1 sodium/potassium-transporting ATPase subunit beta-2-like [Lutzomyia longipalpis]XP_055682374.1 sodium/potassium-tra
MANSKDKSGMSQVTYEFPYMKPQDKFSLGKFLYNSENGTIMSRTPKDWGKLLIFYAIFYTVLAALFAICLQGLFYTITKEYPKWQMERSLIGTNPGVGFRPISEDTAQGSLIWFKASDPDSIRPWTKLLDDYLAPYQNKSLLPGGGKNQEMCDFDSPPKPGRVCAVEVSKWEHCNAENDYGYSKSSPCIFVKLNRIFNWVPDFYDDVNDLPDDMPEELKSHIAQLDASKRKQVWISCRGEHPSDREAIGPIKYIPSHGMASYYYPFTNIPGYLSPIIAVHLERPALNRLINIECRAWAKNIQYQGGRDRSGSVHLELMID